MSHLDEDEGLDFLSLLSLGELDGGGKAHSTIPLRGEPEELIDLWRFTASSKWSKARFLTKFKDRKKRVCLVSSALTLLACSVDLEKSLAGVSDSVECEFVDIDFEALLEKAFKTESVSV